MLKKTIVILLTILVMNLGIFAFAGSGNESKSLEKVKADIAKLATGPDAKVEVKLKDGSKVKGYISESNDEQFVVTDLKTARQTPVSYSHVRKARGHNTKLGIAIGVGILVTLIVLVTTQLK
jgi:hypothetical protein